MTSRLPTRTLGRTGLEVTTLGYGAMALNVRSGPTITTDEARGILHAVLDAGINLIDTSPDYGPSEELIGASIAGRRDEFVLASKCGCIVSATPGEGRRRKHIYTVDNVVAGVEQSLRRMRTDRIDVVQFHGSPPVADLEEHGAVEALQRLQADGKVRFIGMSGVLPDLADHIEMGVFDVFQIPYSLVQREHETLIARAAAAGGGTVVRGGVARGNPAPDKGWGARRLPELAADQPRQIWERAALDDLLDGASRIEFTLRFTLSHPWMHTTIVGTANLDHLRDNLESARKGPLPADVYQEAMRRLDEAAAAWSDRA